MARAMWDRLAAESVPLQAESRHPVPALFGIDGVKAAQQVRVWAGDDWIRAWAFPPPAPGTSIANLKTPVITRRVLLLVGQRVMPESIDVSLPTTAEVSVHLQKVTDLGRSWEVDIPKGLMSAMFPVSGFFGSPPIASLLGSPPFLRYRWLVVANGDQWLLARPRHRPDEAGRSGQQWVQLNKFQRELLGVVQGDQVTLSPAIRSSRTLGGPSIASDRRRPHSLRPRVRGPRRWVFPRTVWRSCGMAVEFLLRLFLKAPMASMVVSEGPQGDDEETARLDEGILPFIGIEEGDQLIVRHGYRRSLVTSTARGVPAPTGVDQPLRVPPNRMVRDTKPVTTAAPADPTSDISDKSKKQLVGVAPDLMISLPGPVRADLDCYIGSVVQVQRKTTSVVARRAQDLMAPVLSTLIAWAVLQQVDAKHGVEWVKSAGTIGVGAVTLLLVLLSMRHRPAKRGPWPR